MTLVLMVAIGLCLILIINNIKLNSKNHHLKEEIENEKNTLKKYAEESLKATEEKTNLKNELEAEKQYSNKLIEQNFLAEKEKAKLAKEIEGLQKYKRIENLEKETQLLQAKKIDLTVEMNNYQKKRKEEAEIMAKETMREALELKKDSEKEYNHKISEANIRAKETTEAAEIRAKEITSAADLKAKEITDNAEAKAKDIAGKAYDALKKIDNLESTSKALKNIIEGYGDKYLIPTHTLIDSLADEYSHTNAGEDLKRARERIRLMVENKTAADCDYVEDNRKTTAINFVIDAFNGKVDSILTSVKSGNYGTLKQKIIDSFHTVNTNGEAFRNARINETYLNARLEELNLACTVQALKEKDKEEQRAIRERLREEEKAAKEYERALKEAQKDQETVTKAIDKVRKELDEASAAKRQVYEEKLKELELRLKEAEEKNKRAQSMAELTKSGYVYIISNIGSFGDDILKIGMTRRLDPMDRIDELGDASVPFEFDVHAMIYSEDAPGLEKELHSMFVANQVNKVNPRKEFFKLGIAEIKAVVEKKGFTVHWTMQAEAREYRESEALKQLDRKAA